jgi:hypothetical protein
MDENDLRKIVRTKIGREHDMQREPVQIARQIAEQHDLVGMTNLVGLVIEETVVSQNRVPLG